ncbi:MAG: hypothetical protein FP816_11595 [Desulfobacteraceae bacterium]|nr:hypothetical protein [Desulfobacteraceae bacterium]
MKIFSRPDQFPRSIKRIFQLVIFLALIFNAQLSMAWNEQLIDAAKAFNAGTATGPQRVMLLARNYEVNLLSMAGKIDNSAFQACQRDFAEISQGIAKTAADNAGVSFTVQKSKSKDYLAATDSDYITGATNADQVKVMQKEYNEEFTKKLNDMGGELDKGTNWTVKNDIDFMGDASLASPEDFLAMAEANNAAYTRKGAARYEAYSRMEGSRTPNLSDTADYVDEMQDMVHHRDVMIRQNGNELSRIMKENNVTKLSDFPIDSKDYEKAMNLKAEIYKNKAIQGKYMERVGVATDDLKKLLPPDAKIGNNLIASSSLPSRAKVRDMVTNRMNPEMLYTMNNDIMQQQLQEHVEVLAAVAHTNPVKAAECQTAIKKYSSSLTPQQKADVIDSIRQGFGPEAARDLASTMRGDSTAATLDEAIGAIKKGSAELNDAMRKGDAVRVRSVLDDMNGNMGKSRSWTNLEGEGPLKEITDRFSGMTDEQLELALKNDAGLRSQLDDALRAARTDAHLLGELSQSTNAQQRMALKGMLSEVAGSKTLWGELKQVLTSVNDVIPIDKALEAIFIYWDTLEASQLAGEGDLDGASRKAFEALLGAFSGVSPALMASLTNTIIDATKAAGFEMAVASQDCEDLLVNIISVKGWESASGVGDKSEISVERLARQVAEEKRLRNILETHITNLATTQDGTTKINEGKKKALSDKCTENIVSLWRKHRTSMVMNYIVLLSQFEKELSSMPIDILFSPPEVDLAKEGDQMTVTMEIRPEPKALEQVNTTLSMLETELKALGGIHKLTALRIVQTINWNPPKGITIPKETTDIIKIYPSLAKAEFTVKKEGAYAVTADITWQVDVISAITDGGDSSVGSYNFEPYVSRDWRTGEWDANVPLNPMNWVKWKETIKEGDPISTYKDEMERTIAGHAEGWVTAAVPSTTADGRVIMTVKGPAEVEEGKDVELSVNVKAMHKADTEFAEKSEIAWFYLEKKIATGRTYKFKSEKPIGTKLFTAKALGDIKGTKEILANAVHKLKVVAPPEEPKFKFRIEGPTQVEVNQPVSLKVVITPENNTAREVERKTYGAWSVNGQDFGPGDVCLFNVSDVGEYKAQVVIFLDDKEITTLYHTVTAKEQLDVDDDSEDLAATIARLKAARDWEGLVALLQKENNSEETDKGKQLERTAAINKALQELKKERQEWLLKYKEYLTSLQGLNDSQWSEFDKGMQLQRNKVQEKCNKECRNCKDQCVGQANEYYDDCAGTLKEDHSKEVERLSAALKELPALVEKLVSRSYEHAQWFKEVDALVKKYQLPRPYPDPVVNIIEYYSACLDEKIVDEEIEEVEALSVKINGPTAVIEVGMLANLTASVSGGMPPYNFTWSTASGSGSSASFKPSSMGDWTVNVNIMDSEGNTGSDSFIVRVGPGKVNMKGLKGDVYYGEVTLLSAWGMGLTVQKTETKPEKLGGGGDDCPDGPFCVDYKNSGTITPKAEKIPDDRFYPENASRADSERISDPSSEFARGKAPKDKVKNEDRVVWQAEPGVTFDPPTSTDGMTKITYDRMGEIKVWCELHKFIDGAYQTVGESEQETVVVKPPSFSISFEPENGVALIGQTVRATINATPAVEAKLIDYRWLDPATSNRMQLDANGRKIEFTVNDLNPVKLKVLARVPTLGDDIGEIESSYTGVSFSVNAWMVQPPNLPQTWDPKKGGLITLTKSQRGTGELITLKAEVQGSNVPDPVRWEWTVNEGTTISNPISQTPTVSRSEAGSINAKVKATDNNKRSLGKAEVSVSVIEIIPDPGVKKEKEAAAAKEAKEKEEKAQVADKIKKAEQAKKVIIEIQSDAKKGKFDEAIAKGEEALKTDPENKEIKDHIDQVKKEKEIIDNGLKTVEQLIESSEFQQAQEKLIPLQNKASYYPPVQKMDRTLGEKWQAHMAKVNAALGDVNEKSKSKDYKEALESIEVARKTLKLLPSELKTLADQEWYCKEQEGKKEKARQLFNTAKEKLDSNDFEGSIKDYKEGSVLANNLWNFNTDKTPANAEEVYRLALEKKKEFEAAQLKAAEKKRIEPVFQKEPSLQAAYQTNKVISANAAEIITLSNVDIKSANRIRILITQASGLTAKGRQDTARIGEVEFYHIGRKLLPISVAAESVYPGGYSPEQTIDGVRKYSYLVNGPRGWASALKASGSATWIEFTFASPVDVDNVIVTTAPTDPYRLYNFELQSNLSGSGKSSVASDVNSVQIAGKYFINANGHKGSLIFSGTENRLECVLNLGKPEKMKDVRVEGKKITFTRVIGTITQVFTGEISGASDKLHFEGPFTSQGGVYKWFADMTEIAKKGSSNDGLSKIMGKWTVNTNGYKGTLILKNGSGKIQGILNLNIGDEQLEGVSFDGITLKFTRPLPKLKLTQDFTGTVSEKESTSIMHVQGTFSTNGIGASPWSGDLGEPEAFY